MRLPKIETLIIFVFFACVALWAVSRCSAKRSTLVRSPVVQDEEREERPVRRDTVVAVPAPATQVPVNTQRPVNQPVTVQPVPAPTTTTPVAPGMKPARTPAPASTPLVVTASKYSTLYVTIDGLKMRKSPSLKGDVVTKLELYEPVFFLNQKSEKTEEISLGKEKVTDHWVKVRTQAGKEGWVFGAGVHYYKMKRKGVIE